MTIERPDKSAIRPAATHNQLNLLPSLAFAATIGHRCPSHEASALANKNYNYTS